MKVIECPRDAMQGFSKFIPTLAKISYINQLIRVGFDTIDFGSFVSSRIIPQLKDTEKVLDGLDLSPSNTKLLSIIANIRGAKKACQFDKISYLGFPLSVSEEFQKRNTNMSINDALNVVAEIKDLVSQKNKEIVVYLSMAFGNPYNEAYNIDLVSELTYKLSQMGIKTISLSDTIGISSPINIGLIFKSLISNYPRIEFGAHFHTHPNKWNEKITAAYTNGCRRFDGVINGFGGCPMADSHLIGNMPTENIIDRFNNELDLNIEEFKKSLMFSKKLFK
jgi:hydroxymethylglutaryl-CoA lyase